MNSILEEIKNIKSSKKDLRNFSLTTGIVFLGLGGFLVWRERPASVWFLGLGTSLVVLGLAVPSVLKPLQKGWMTIAVVLGWIMSRIILSVFYYGVVTPIGLGARCFGKTFLDLSTDKGRKSHWRPRPTQPFDKKQYERQF